MVKTLLLGKKLEELRQALKGCETKDAELQKREEELAGKFDALTDESTDEEKEELDKEMSEYDTDKEANEKEKKDLEREIQETESELKELEDAQKEQAAPESSKNEGEEPEERKDYIYKGATKMFKTRAIRNMTAENRTAFEKSDALHNFAENIRALAAKGQTRAVTGGELLIPTEILPLVEEEIYGNSRLIGLVNTVRVSGKARQNIAAKSPEGIWTEMCASLNELKIEFTDIEVDGYKVGGYVPVCNALLADSDINLVDEVTSKLAEGIAYALDKAIVYGTGTKMPTGFAGTATKVNISGKTDLAIYKAFIEATGSLNHGRGATLWCMNRKTRMKMVAASMSIDAAGAIVAGQNGVMPVEGGVIVEEDFVPDDEIVGGYGLDYLLAEREGTSLAVSEHVKFIEDETVFRAIARYDGKPIFADGFLAIGLAGDPTGAIDANHPFATAS